MTNPSAPPDLQGKARRLAAILSADIVGYSRLMGLNEDATHLRVKNILRDVVNPAVTEHRGRVFKNMGDGFLAVFDSPIEAVRCAIVIQQAMTMRNLTETENQKIQYRIGINLGDVIVDGDDIFGDGVNVAARVQTLAQPGGVYISGGVYEQVKNKLVVGYQSLGDEKLKNITDPVHIYRVLPDLSAVSQAHGRTKPRWPMPVAVASVLGVALLAWVSWVYLFSPGSTDLRRTAAVPPAVKSAPLPPQAAKEEAAVSPDATVAPVQRTPASPSPVVQSPAAPPTSPSSDNSSGAIAPVQPSASPDIRPPTPPAQKAEGDAAGAAKSVDAANTANAGSKNSTDAFRDCATCPELLRVAPGSFDMGAKDISFAQPVHRVTISKAFALSRAEITFEEWDVCVQEGGCSHRPNDRSWGRGKRPVIDVSWTDAKGFASWLSRKTGQRYRLPTEAEWEYAARGGTDTAFFWGRTLGNGNANCDDCSSSPARRTLPIGSFAPNPFGFLDIAGNAAEWVEDCWNDSYRDVPKDGSAATRGQCELRVLRGGGFSSTGAAIRSSARYRYDYDVRYYTNGFRVARELQ